MNMQTDKIQSLNDFALFISEYLAIQIENRKSERNIPTALKQLYHVKAAYNIKLPGNELFSKQDILQPESNLTFYNDKMFFLTENSGNWSLYTKTGEREMKVYLQGENGVYGVNGETVSESLDEFLITYALQELIFAMKYLTYGTHSEQVIKEKFKHQTSLWTKKRYVVKDAEYDFYLLDNDCLFMNADGLPFLGTNNLKKIQLLHL